MLGRWHIDKLTRGDIDQMTTRREINKMTGDDIPKMAKDAIVSSI